MVNYNEAYVGDFACTVRNFTIAYLLERTENLLEIGLLISDYYICLGNAL